MPKVSKTTATTQFSIPGWVDAAMSEVDGYSVEIERWDVEMDFAFTLEGLPNDQCQAHHVGYVLKGKIIFPMDDGSEEVFEAGDAYVLAPGHKAPVVTAGTEYVTFTPAEEARAMAPVLQANMMKYMQEHGIEVPG